MKGSGGTARGARAGNGTARVGKRQSGISDAVLGGCALRPNVANVCAPPEHLRRLTSAARYAARQFPTPSRWVALEELVAAGWLAFEEATAQGETVERAYRLARSRMEGWLRAELVPVQGDVRVTRTLRILSGDQPVSESDTDLSPYDLDTRGGHYSRRLTPGQWRDFRAFLRRVLTPAEADLMRLLCCERMGLYGAAHALGMGETAAYVARSRAIRKLMAAAA